MIVTIIKITTTQSWPTPTSRRKGQPRANPNLLVLHHHICKKYRFYLKLSLFAQNAGQPKAEGISFRRPSNAVSVRSAWCGIPWPSAEPRRASTNSSLVAFFLRARFQIMSCTAWLLNDKRCPCAAKRSNTLRHSAVPVST